MPESFGAQLRQQREERGIALATIAQQTKIKLALLEALERDDVSQWPSGMYRRAFFRAYARAIELDPDRSFQEFLRVHPEPPEIDVLAAMAAALDRGESQTRPAAALRNVVGSAFASLARRRRAASASVADDAVTNGTLNEVVPAPEPRTTAPARQAESIGAGAATAPSFSDRHAAVFEPDLRPEAVPPAATDPPPPPSAPMNAGEAVPATAPMPASSPELDLLAVAQLCTEMGRVERLSDVQPLLHDAARMLDATGVIVWLWDESIAQLAPALVHGYPDKVVAQLPTVGVDDDNATAAAFRSAQPRTVGDRQRATAAVVVPLLSAIGCTGVLAIELRRGRDHSNAVIALATILAAQLAQVTSAIYQYVEMTPARLVVGGVPQPV